MSLVWLGGELLLQVQVVNMQSFQGKELLAYLKAEWTSFQLTVIVELGGETFLGPAAL